MRTSKRMIDLVTAATIAALSVTVLGTAFRAVRERRDGDTCLENLHRLGIAMRMYEEDFNEALVPYAISFTTPSGSYSARCTKLLYPYMGDPGVFLCPSSRLNTDKLTVEYPSAYGVNWYIAGYSGGPTTTAVPPHYRSFVKDPSHTIWAADTTAVTKASATLPAEQWQEDLKQAATADIYYFYLPQHPITGAVDPAFPNGGFSGMIIRPFPRHSGKVNVTFYDGHAAPVPASQFDPNVTKWGQKGCWWDNVPG